MLLTKVEANFMCTAVNNLNCSVPWTLVCASPLSWFVIVFQLAMSWKIYLKLPYFLAGCAWMMTTLAINNPCRLGIFFQTQRDREITRTYEERKKETLLSSIILLVFYITPPKPPVLVVKIHLVTVYVILKCFWKLPLKSVIY